MDNTSNKHLSYGLPLDFYKAVKQYVEIGIRIQTEDELIELWRHAFDAAEKHKDNRDSIAEWTMSIGSYTPYINDNDIYEAIHLGFGSLEIADHSLSKQAADREWAQQKKLFETLLRERAQL